MLLVLVVLILQAVKVKKCSNWQGRWCGSLAGNAVTGSKVPCSVQSFGLQEVPSEVKYYPCFSDFNEVDIKQARVSGRDDL